MPNNDQLPVQTDRLSLSIASVNTQVSRLTDQAKRQFAARLFLNFASIWGPKWSDYAVGFTHDEIAGVWAGALEDMTLGQVERKMKICRNTLAWPPSPAELIWAGEPKRPKSRAGWLAWGKTSGNDAKTGESWDDYLARLESTWDANGGAPA